MRVSREDEGAAPPPPPSSSPGRPTLPAPLTQAGRHPAASRRGAALRGLILEKRLISATLATLNAALHRYLGSLPALLPNPPRGGARSGTRGGPAAIAGGAAKAAGRTVAAVREASPAPASSAAASPPPPRAAAPRHARGRAAGERQVPRAAAPPAPFNLSVDFGPVGLQLARRRLEGAGCAHLLVEAVLPGGLAHRDGRAAAGMVVHRVGRRRAAGLTVRAVQRRLLQATPERSVALALVPAAAASCDGDGGGGVGDAASADAAPSQGRPKTKSKKRKKRRGVEAG